MKVCVTASEKSLEAQLDPRFGRCRFFIIVDPESMEFEAIENFATESLHGAGVQAAQTVVNRGVEAIIAGNVGPNALQVLSAAGIRVITGASGTVKEVIERYRRGEFQSNAGSSVPAHFGMGFGMRMGLRRGMGGGRWRSLGMGAEAPSASCGITFESAPTAEHSAEGRKKN